MNGFLKSTQMAILRIFPILITLHMVSPIAFSILILCMALSNLCFLSVEKKKKKKVNKLHFVFHMHKDSNSKPKAI